MTNPSPDFTDFDEEFKKADKAEPGAALGRLPVGVYKGVCTSVNLEGDGVLVDHESFETGKGTKGFKLFFEILDPEKVGETTTKGAIHEHVFWITRDNLPYVKRDIAAILGRDLESLSELKKIQWAGKTLEFGLKDDTYQGFTRSKTTFINAWAPPKEGAKKDAAPAKAADDKKGAEKPAAKKETAKAGGDKKTDF